MRRTEICYLDLQGAAFTAVNLATPTAMMLKIIRSKFVNHFKLKRIFMYFVHMLVSNIYSLLPDLKPKYPT